MLRLNANKTSLYNLVSGYEKLPARKWTDFAKAYRRPDYILEWSDRSGLICTAYLAAVLGRPTLTVKKREFCGLQVSSVVHNLDLQDLRRRGMVQQVTTAAERRRTERGAAHGAV